VSRFEGKNGDVVRFESVDAYMTEIRDRGVKLDFAGHGTWSEWSGGLTGEDARARAVTGDPSLVASFDASLSALTATVGEDARNVWTSDVYGSRPDVGAYLAGAPRCMKRRVKRETETRHVSIYVSLVAWSGSTASDMVKRGVAIMGLLSALQSMRVSVDLFLVLDTAAHDPKRGDVGDYTQVIRVESRPLDLSTSGFAIAHPAFTRHVTYSYTHHMTGWRSLFSETFTASGLCRVWRAGEDASEPTKRYIDAIGKRIGMLPTDVFVCPMIPGDAVLRDPAEWIRRNVTQALGHQEVVT